MSQSIQGGFLGNAGALSDLVYRGEPVGFQNLPYYGGGINIAPLGGQMQPGFISQGIPVGEDPRFPMDQQLFQHYVEERRLKNNPQLAPYGGSILQYLKNNPVRGV